MLRPRPDLNARLLVELAITLDEAGLQRIDDHRRRLVEAFPRFIHAEAERGELTPGQAASQTKAQPPLAQHVEHRRLLGDARRAGNGFRSTRMTANSAGIASP